MSVESSSRGVRGLVLSLLCAAAGVASAADWYVDAVNGNDAWDGTRPMSTASGTAGPRKTLAAAMALAGEGDTVYAAAGTYDQGGMWHDNGGITNRVVVLRGRRLVATEGKARTVIKGKKGTSLTYGS